MFCTHISNIAYGWCTSHQALSLPRHLTHSHAAYLSCGRGKNVRSTAQRSKETTAFLTDLMKTSIHVLMMRFPIVSFRWHNVSNQQRRKHSYFALSCTSWHRFFSVGLPFRVISQTSRNSITLIWMWLSCVVGRLVPLCVSAGVMYFKISHFHIPIANESNIVGLQLRMLLMFSFCDTHTFQCLKSNVLRKREEIRCEKDRRRWKIYLEREREREQGSRKSDAENRRSALVALSELYSAFYASWN